MPNLVVVIDGIIGAGKSRYLQIINEALTSEGIKIKVIEEPVEKWKKNGMLELFYSDIVRYAYTFQTMVYIDRINAVREGFEENNGDENTIFILERSCFTDNIFMDVLYEDNCVTDIEMECYRSWCKFWNKMMPLTPNKFLYLRTSIDICMKRTKSRKRNGESTVSVEYQEKLMKKHDDFLLSGNVKISDEITAKSYIIDVEADNVTDEVERVRLVNEFKRIIGK